jgi:hypothetical protein
LVAANPICGTDYQALLACGATKSAASWTCYTLGTTTTPIPPTTAAPDGCLAEFTTLSLVLLANPACVTALAP